jgi:adenylate cyclase
MTKILVADDEADLEMLIKQKFRQKIREQQYEFVFAINGNDALEKIKMHPDIDIVLSDINMPEMDGLTLLSRLGESSPLIKAVMVSAYGDMDNIRTAMNRGAFDFITKPVNFDDLSLTMEKTIKHVVQLRQTLKAMRMYSILWAAGNMNLRSWLMKRLKPRSPLLTSAVSPPSASGNRPIL